MIYPQSTPEGREQYAKLRKFLRDFSARPIDSQADGETHTQTIRPMADATSAHGMSEYNIILRSEKGHTAPPDKRLARLLKTALRVFGLRCVRCSRQGAGRDSDRGEGKLMAKGGTE